MYIRGKWGKKWRWKRSETNTFKYFLGVHKIIEHRLARDLKNHLSQVFLAKAWFRQGGPALYPSES